MTVDSPGKAGPPRPPTPRLPGQPIILDAADPEANDDFNFNLHICAVCQQDASLLAGVTVLTCGKCGARLHVDCAEEIFDSICPGCDAKLFKESRQEIIAPHVKQIEVLEKKCRDMETRFQTKVNGAADAIEGLQKKCEETENDCLARVNEAFEEVEKLQQVVDKRQSASVDISKDHAVLFCKYHIAYHMCMEFLMAGLYIYVFTTIGYDANQTLHFYGELYRSYRVCCFANKTFIYGNKDLQPLVDHFKRFYVANPWQGFVYLFTLFTWYYVEFAFVFGGYHFTDLADCWLSFVAKLVMFYGINMASFYLSLLEHRRFIPNFWWRVLVEEDPGQMVFRMPNGEKKKICLKRRPFGMRIITHNHVAGTGAVVVEIKTGDAAHECGVKKDYVLESISGINVTKFQFDKITNMIKCLTKDIK